MIPSTLYRIILAVLSLVAISREAVAASIGDAAAAGDTAEVQRLLDEGADPNQKGVGSPLYFAAQRGHVKVVELLLEAGAEVNAVTRFGTALQIAARGNRIQIVEVLLENGADPNIPGGPEMKMPLHDAAERGALEAARVLLENGADVNGRTSMLHPPIHLAAFKGKDDLVALLGEFGASPMNVEPLAPGELAKADPEQGRIRAIECGQCHALEIGTAPVGPYPGPDLWNVVGRGKASLANYAYSKALAKQNGAWTYEELNRFLADATGYVPGTNMGHGFEPERNKRVPLIAYLRTLSDNPLPLE